MMLFYQTTIFLFC